MVLTLQGSGMQARHISLIFGIFGVAWMLYAINGILRREITTQPRGRPGKTYTARAAVWQGLVELMFGFAFAAVAFVLHWFSTHDP